MEFNKIKNALLLGNGVNLLDYSQSVSWRDLLKDIKEKYNISVEIDNEFKPFPLGFEEMLHQKEGTSSLERKLKNFKKEIRTIINHQLQGKKGYNQYHKQLAKVGYDDILTTNYDYSLEKSVTPDFEQNKIKYALNKQESKFSLKRKYGLIPNLKSNIWHIHGELYDSRNLSPDSNYYHEESIMIGYEHYTEYLEKIQENIKGKKGKRIVDDQSLMSRIGNHEQSPFWIDILFTHNIDIVGFGFDFSENHLWWLLNYRATIIRGVDKPKTKSKTITINNEIKFYYPDQQSDYTIKINEKDALQKFLKKVNQYNKSKAISDVLKSFKVIPKPIKCISYKDFYNKYLIEKRDELSY